MIIANYCLLQNGSWVNDGHTKQMSWTPKVGDSIAHRSGMHQVVDVQEQNNAIMLFLA